MTALVPRRVDGEEWPGVPTGEAASDWSVYLTLDHTQWLDPEAIEAGQLRQVRRLLAHCREHVPYYRDRLSAAGITPAEIQTMADFRRVPILHRPTYQEEGARMHADALPRGTRATGRIHTAGSSGRPVEVLQTDLVDRWGWGCYLRDLEWCGVDPRGRLAVIRQLRGAERAHRLHGLRQPYWNERLHTVVETGPCHVMDVHEDVSRQLDWLVRVDPEYLLGVVSNVEALAGAIGDRGQKLPSLRVIETFGETLTDSTRQRIEGVFGVPMRNLYRSCEAGYIATRCPEEVGLHVHAENVLVEVLDDADRPCSPGQTGRVVLTTLQNFRSPFVRYDIMDEAEVGARCTCGRGLPVLTRVIGRRRPFFRLPDERLKSCRAIGEELRQLGDVRQFQVVQRAPDHVIVRIVPAPGWTGDHERRVVAMVCRHFEAHIRVDVETVTRILPTPGGKVLDFVREFGLEEGDPAPVDATGPPMVAAPAVPAPGRRAGPWSRPLSLRPRTAGGSEWPPLPTADAAQTWSMYLRLERSQWLAPAELEAGQLTQLRRIVSHCAAHVPHYRELFASIRFAPDDLKSWDDFRRLPLLSRPTVNDRADALRAERLPPGTRRTAQAQTSGTSGVPVIAQQTNVVDLWWLAVSLRNAAWCGIDYSGTLASIRATGESGSALQRLLDGVTLPGWSATLGSIVKTGQFHLMDIHQEPWRQLEWLTRVAPDYLMSFPSNVECLANLARDEGIHLPALRAVQVIGEELTDGARALIESTFGVPVWNTYSCSEAGFIADPCPEGHGLHVHAENVLVEVLDGDDRPCPPSATGRVVLTTLHNFLMPLVRYDIMDDAQVGPARCPCGRGLPILTRVLGRRRPVVTLPGDRMTNSSGLSLAIMAVGGFHQFQVVQRALDHFVVRVVPGRAWRAEHGDRIATAAREQLDPRVRVDVVPLERLELPRGGKLRSFVSELDPPAPRRPA